MSTATKDSDLFGHLSSPANWVHYFWPDYKLYDKQVEILESVQTNINTFVHAANETGKGFTAAVVAIWFFCSRQPSRVLITSSSDRQLDSVLWPEIVHLIEESRVKLPLRVTHHNIHKTKSNGEDYTLDFLRGFSPDKPESFQGQHLPNDIPRTCVIMDEASAGSNAIFEAELSFAHRTLHISNPMNVQNFFYQQCRKGDIEDPAGGPGLLNKVIHIHGNDSPNVQVAREWKRLAKEGPAPVPIPGLLTHDEYLRREQMYDEVSTTIRLYGQFYEGDQAMLYPVSWLNNAERRTSDIDSEYVKFNAVIDANRAMDERQRKSKRKVRTAVAMGLDGAEGRDNTVWTIIDKLGVLKQIVKKTPNPMEVVGETMHLIREYGIAPSNVCIDAGGGGNAYIASMREQGVNCQAVVFSGTATPIKPVKGPSGKLRATVARMIYKNRRAEMYGILREMLDPTLGDKVFGLPIDCPSLREELSVMPLQFDSEGRMHLPPKEQSTARTTGQVSIRELLGRSPDRADSLVLATFALKRAAKVPRVIVGSTDMDKDLKDRLQSGIARRLVQYQYKSRQ